MGLFKASQKEFIGAFPLMNEYLTNFRNMKDREVLGREEETRSVLANLARKELTNVGLIGPAGVGKTALVQHISRIDTDRLYFKVELALMATSSNGVNGSIEMAPRLIKLFDEIMRFQKKFKQELVIFMDEFHMITKVSPAALQALKPLLAESGRHNVRIILATTSDEYEQFIRGDEALNERIQPVKINPTTRDTVISILKSMKSRYVPAEIISNKLFEDIVDITDQYLPAQAQPRKSVVLFDAMIGWHNKYKKPFNQKTLSEVLKVSQGVDINQQMPVEQIDDYLHSRIIDQDYAIQAVLNRLYMVRSHLNDPTRPLGSLLFTGPTGVGKTELAKSLANVMYGRDSAMIRFDMSEFSVSSTVDLFRKELATQAWERPTSILLLDEIEKAAPEVTKLLLQVLDDAEISDRHNRLVSFKNMFIIMTTNAANAVYERYNRDNAANSKEAEDSKAQFLQSLSSDQQLAHKNETLLVYQELIEQELQSYKAFPPELLGRIDSIIPFNPLERHGRVKITEMALNKLRMQVAKQSHVRLHFDDRIIKMVVDENIRMDTNSGGGRDINRRVANMVTTPVARFIVFNPHVRDLAVNVAGKFWTDNLYDKVGSTHVEVNEWRGSRRVSHA